MKSEGTLMKFAVAVIIMMAASLAASAQFDVRQVTAAGRNGLATDNLPLAIDCFTIAINARPYLAEPYYYRGLTKFQRGDYVGAEEDCTLAIERHRFLYDAYRIRGFARQSLHKDSAAIADYGIALQNMPYDQQILFNKGNAHTALKQYALADSAYIALLKVYPSFEEGHLARAGMLLESGNPHAALESIDKAIAIRKNLLPAHLLKADIYATLGEWENALTTLDDAMTLRPDIKEIYLSKALVYLKAGDLRPALEYITKVEAMEPQNVSALFLRGLVYYRLADFDSAIADFKEVIKHSPHFSEAHRIMADAYRHLGTTREAYANTPPTKRSATSDYNAVEELPTYLSPLLRISPNSPAYLDLFRQFLY